MQESSVYQYIIEKGRVQGIEQGERKSTIESILELLDIRFHVGVDETLKPAIERISNLQRLRQLRRAAAQVQSLEAFIQTLEANNDSD